MDEYVKPKRYGKRRKKNMESPEILKKAHDEWMAEANGVYECLIPKEGGPRLED